MSPCSLLRQCFICNNNANLQLLRLAQHDMVITTYAIINNECDKNGAVFRVKWRRIIIDEAHQIRNHKSQTSEAVCKLPAKSRWALTGTPVHNKELDMYSLLKFLRLSPFDDLVVRMSFTWWFCLYIFNQYCLYKIIYSCAIWYLKLVYKMFFINNVFFTMNICEFNDLVFLLIFLYMPTYTVWT